MGVLLQDVAQTVQRTVGIQVLQALLGDDPVDFRRIHRLQVLNAVDLYDLRLVLDVLVGLALFGHARDGARLLEQVRQVTGRVHGEVVGLQLVHFRLEVGSGLRRLHERQDAEQRLATRGHGLEQVLDALRSGNLGDYRLFDGVLFALVALDGDEFLVLIFFGLNFVQWIVVLEIGIEI